MKEKLIFAKGFEVRAVVAVDAKVAVRTIRRVYAVFRNIYQLLQFLDAFYSTNRMFLRILLERAIEKVTYMQKHRFSSYSDSLPFAGN